MIRLAIRLRRPVAEVERYDPRTFLTMCEEVFDNGEGDPLD